VHFLNSSTILFLSIISFNSFSCDDGKQVFEEKTIEYLPISHPININVPKDSVTVKVTHEERPKENKAFYQDIGFWAFIFAIGSFVYTMHVTSKREARIDAISCNDEYWFRDVVAPNIMEPLLEDIKSSAESYSAIKNIEDETDMYEAADEFIENWDETISKAIERVIYLSALPGGEETAGKIKLIFQRLLSTYTMGLFEESLAVTPEQNQVTPYDYPHLDAAKELIQELKLLQSNLYN
jgi:hypothetical protein